MSTKLNTIVLFFVLFFVGFAGTAQADNANPSRAPIQVFVSDAEAHKVLVSVDWLSGDKTRQAIRPRLVNIDRDHPFAWEAVVGQNYRVRIMDADTGRGINRRVYVRRSGVRFRLPARNGPSDAEVINALNDEVSALWDKIQSLKIDHAEEVGIMQTEYDHLKSEKEILQQGISQLEADNDSLLVQNTLLLQRIIELSEQQQPLVELDRQFASAIVHRRRT